MVQATSTTKKKNCRKNSKSCKRRKKRKGSRKNRRSGRGSMRIGRNKMSIKAKKSMVIIGTRRVRKRHGPTHLKKKSRILRRS